MAENADGAVGRLKEASGHFQREGFAGAGLAEQDQGLARQDLEGDAAEDFALVETDVNVLEFDGRSMRLQIGE